MHSGSPPHHNLVDVPVCGGGSCQIGPVVIVGLLLDIIFQNKIVDRPAFAEFQESKQEPSILWTQVHEWNRICGRLFQLAPLLIHVGSNHLEDLLILLDRVEVVYLFHSEAGPHSLGHSGQLFQMLPIEETNVNLWD